MSANGPGRRLSTDSGQEYGGLTGPHVVLIPLQAVSVELFVVCAAALFTVAPCEVQPVEVIGRTWTSAPYS
jgi:hypothetical protein